MSKNVKCFSTTTMNGSPSALGPNSVPTRAAFQLTEVKAKMPERHAVSWRPRLKKVTAINKRGFSKCSVVFGTACLSCGFVSWSDLGVNGFGCF